MTDTDRPTLDARHESFAGLFPDGGTLERVQTGFGFTEGPIWHPHERWLMFSDIAESIQYRLDGDDLAIFRRPSNQANGNCFDLSGQVVSCEHAGSRLVVHDHGGKRVRALATHYDEAELNSPNDVICDARGAIWFTDPAYGRTRPDLGIVRRQAQETCGVYRLDPDGTLTRVIDDMDQPNGLCLSPDGARLFVNDTPRGHVRVWDLADGRTPTGGAVWAEVTGDGPGVVDGMKATSCGHLLVNGPGGVHVLSLDDATCLGVIRVPEKTTNFCFAHEGPGAGDPTTLYVTASTSIYRIRTRMRGIPMIAVPA